MASKAVLITGCSTGIGRATAERLVGKGHTVYATARKAETLADLEAKGCKTLALDVTSEESMRAAVDHVVAAEGAVWGLVNNAGYSQTGALESLDMDEVRRQFETNVFGLLRMCQLCLPSMREQRSGRIVNMSSMGANFVFPGGGIYHATKYAVDAMSDALRFEVKGFGVDVVIIQPGLIKTEFGETASASTPTGDDDAYGHFNATVAQTTKEAYEKGFISKFGAGPEAVAKAVERALTTSRPRARYRVTASAKLLRQQRRLVTDGIWDAMMRTQFPQPGEAVKQRIEKLLLALPDVSVRLSHGHPGFFRKKKQFAFYMDRFHDDTHVAVWCAAPEGMQQALVEGEPEHYFRPPYVGHRGWVGIRLDTGLAWDNVAGALEDAYDHVG